MFVSFLLPVIDRGAGPLFHWVMLAQMARFDPDEIIFLGDEEYFEESSVPFDETIGIGGLQFCCPSRDRFRQFRRICLSKQVFAQVYANNESNHLEVFREALTTSLPSLVAAIEEAVHQLRREGCALNIEAFLTWCNCPSLTDVALRFGVPVIHNEIGPLRSPLYVDTIYFDFAGVNGHSTPATWGDAADLHKQMRGAELLEMDALRGHFIRDFSRIETLKPLPAGERFEIGVALQVEDDSNIVAFSNGWGGVQLLYEAVTHHLPKQISVRSHPHARFKYQGGLGVVDDSLDSIEFLSRCKRIISVNSSLLTEAALWEVPFTVKGDCPVRCLMHGEQHSEEERVVLANAFFLGYLVPAQLLFDKDYYRWRLAKPRRWAECHVKHLGVIDSLRFHLGSLSPGAEVPQETTNVVRLPALWTQTTSLERRLASADERARNAINEVRLLRSECDQLRHVNNALTVKLAEIDTQHRDDIDTFKLNANDLGKEILELRTKADTFGGERKHFRQNIADLELRLNDSAEESELVRHELAAKLVASELQYREKADALKLKINDLEKEVVLWRTKADTVWDEREHFRQNIADLEQRLGESSERIELVRHELAAKLVASELQYREKADALKLKINDLEKDIVLWRTKADTVWDEREHFRQNIADLEQRLGDSSERIELIRHELAAKLVVSELQYREKADALKLKINDFEKEVVLWRTKAGAVWDEREYFCKRTAELECALTIRSSELEKCATQCAQMREDVTHLEGRLRSIMHMKIALSDRIGGTLKKLPFGEQ